MMNQEQAREKLQAIGIQFEEGERYPKASEVEKVQALYDLMAGWVLEEMKNQNLQIGMLAGPADDFLKNWVQESVEEFLFG